MTWIPSRPPTHACPSYGLDLQRLTAGCTCCLASGVMSNRYYPLTTRYAAAAGAPPITRTLNRRLVSNYGNIAVPPGLLEV